MSEKTDLRAVPPLPLTLHVGDEVRLVNRKMMKRKRLQERSGTVVTFSAETIDVRDQDTGKVTRYQRSKWITGFNSKVPLSKLVGPTDGEEGA